MANKFLSFYIDHVSRQQNARVDTLASLAASLALPSRTTEKVLLHSRDLYRLKFTLEDSETPREYLQIKGLLETSIDPEPRDWQFSFVDHVL